jgi:hypothetical protein
MTKYCLDMFRCSERDCDVLVRPAARANDRAVQSQEYCPREGCSGHLVYPLPKKVCPVKFIIWQYAEGFHYHHTGTHTHPIGTHEVMMLRKAREEFAALAEANPRLGPAALVAGAPGRKPVGHIAKPLWNIHRVGKEKQKALDKMYGVSKHGNAFASYRLFIDKNPDIVIYEDIGGTGIICLQTPFMAALVVGDPKSTKVDRIENSDDLEQFAQSLSGPIHGLVSDAAHKYWKDPKTVLIITSTYSRALRCWVPVLISWSSGQTDAHYATHFLVLFRSMGREAKARQLEMVDAWVASVRSNRQNRTITHLCSGC